MLVAGSVHQQSGLVEQLGFQAGGDGQEEDDVNRVGEGEGRDVVFAGGVL